VFNIRERHYTVAELATSRNLSPDTIRDLFRDEPGVLKITKPRRGTRGYVVLRIPESVAIRVFDRQTVREIQRRRYDYLT